MWADRVYYQGSTLIESTKYNHDEHTLEVVFHNGKVQMHSEVPSAKALELQKRADGSASAGDYYKEHIQDEYPIVQNG